MSAALPASDPGAEREFDLGRWLHAIGARWWLLVAGLVVGAGLGALAGRGGSSYTASVVLSPGEVFSPTGASVLTYLASRHGIKTLVDSPTVLHEAAIKAGVGYKELPGRISVTLPTSNGEPVPAGRLVQITVENRRPAHAEDAANALGAIVSRQTTSPYVLQSIAFDQLRLAGYRARLKTLRTQIASLNTKLARERRELAPLDRLVLVSQLDQLQASQGSLLDRQTGTRQDLMLAQNVEQTQLIGGKAVAVKVTHSSHRWIVIGSLIGLVIGTIAAVVIAARMSSGPPP